VKTKAAIIGIIPKIALTTSKLFPKYCEMILSAAANAHPAVLVIQNSLDG
jgi:hypothetical protein